MTYKGIIKGNVVVLEPGASLPEGAPVEIRLLAESAPTSVALEKRHAVLQHLPSLQLPVADWEQMEEEIIQGAME